MLGVTIEEQQVTKAVTEKLLDLIDWFAPNALWTELEPHSKECYTLYILTLDYKYTVWRVTLSLDERWTLSPVGGPWQDEPQQELG